MIISKYNIAKGNSTSASKGTTAVSGGGSTVDLTPITDKIAALESKVSTLELQLSRANAVIAGLGERFLSKLGDTTDYAYRLGALYTDYLESEMYGSGVGFRLSGDATAAVEDKYNLFIKDVGWSTVAWTTIQDAEASVVSSNTDEATATLTATRVSIGATSAAGYLLLDCGATLTNERCFTEVAKSVKYYITATTGGQSSVTALTEADTDSNGNYIIYFTAADRIRISITFTYTYAFKKYGDITSGTYRLYIRGTDYENSLTDCFAATSKVSQLNASGHTVMDGNNGYRLTSDGLEVTDDGGTTWTVASTGGGGTAATATEVNNVCDGILS